ncbi:MAG: hypothetical protein MHM6MM_006020, partial [Cercozoa sp. M6MM]
MALKSLVSTVGLALAFCWAAGTSVPAEPPMSCVNVIELDLHGVAYANVEANVHEALVAANILPLSLAQAKCVTVKAICGHGRPWVPVLRGTHSDELRASPGDFAILRRVLKTLRDSSALTPSDSAEILNGFNELRASYSPNVAYFQRENRSLATVHEMLAQAKKAVLSLVGQGGFKVTFALETKPSALPSELSFWNDGALVATIVRLDAEGAKSADDTLGLTSDEAINWTRVK